MIILNRRIRTILSLQAGFLKCRLEIRKISVCFALSFTDFEWTLWPCLEIQPPRVFINEGASSGELEWFFCLYETEVILVLCFVIFRFAVHAIALGDLLEANESAIACNLVCLINISNKVFFYFERWVWRIVSELIAWFRPIWSSHGFNQHVLMREAHSRQVCHEVVAMNFLEGSIFMSEVASLSVWAELFTVKLSTILGLVLFVESGLRFCDPVDLCKLFVAMGVLALETISAETNFRPVLAHLSLILFRVGEGCHLTILYEWHRIVVFISAFCWEELVLLASGRNLSWRNEGWACGTVECKWVGIGTHAVKSFVGLSHAWLWSNGRNWCELRDVCVLRHKALEFCVHAEICGGWELKRHLICKWVAI